MPLKLSIITGVCANLAVTRRWFEETLANCTEINDLVIVSNGNTDEEHDELIDLADHLDWQVKFVKTKNPVGSSRALNLGASEATGDVLAFIHNDLMIKQRGWDLKLLNFFESHPKAGVVGYAGAKQLGAADIYTKPYELTQLGRAYVYTSLEEWQPHGDHCVEPTKVAVLDGLTIACTRTLFDILNGFDESMIHHMYDNDFSLRAHFAGRENWVIPSVVEHVSGQTANMPRWNDWLYKKYGKRDADIHADSHLVFYQKYYDLLPVIVS